MVAGFAVQKAMWLPEKTPQDIIDAYRAAAEKILADAEFKQVIEKSLGGYDQYAGAKARKAFEQVLSVSEADKKWLLNWLKEKYDVDVK